MLGEKSCKINLNQPRTGTGYYKNTIAAFISPFTTANIDLRKINWSALKYLHVADGVKPIKGSFPPEIRESFQIAACCFSYTCKDYTKCTAKSVAWARAGYTTKPLILDPTGKELEWKTRKRIREEEMEKERQASIEKDLAKREQFFKANLCKWYLEGRVSRPPAQYLYGTDYPVSHTYIPTCAVHQASSSMQAQGQDLHKNYSVCIEHIQMEMSFHSRTVPICKPCCHRGRGGSSRCPHGIKPKNKTPHTRNACVLFVNSNLNQWNACLNTFFFMRLKYLQKIIYHG